MFKRNFILLLLTMTVVIVLINSTNNEQLEIVSVSNINDGIVLEDLKQVSNYKRSTLVDKVKAATKGKS